MITGTLSFSALRWLDGLHVESHHFNHCTSMFHLGVACTCQPEARTPPTWSSRRGSQPNESRTSPCRPQLARPACPVHCPPSSPAQSWSYQLVSRGRMQKSQTSAVRAYSVSRRLGRWRRAASLRSGSCKEGTYCSPPVQPPWTCVPPVLLIVHRTALSVSRELPRFGVESRLMYGGRIYHVPHGDQFLPGRVEVPSPTGYLKPSSQLLQKTPLERQVRSWNSPPLRHADSGCCCHLEADVRRLIPTKLGEHAQTAAPESKSIKPRMCAEGCVSLQM